MTETDGVAELEELARDCCMPLPPREHVLFLSCRDGQPQSGFTVAEALSEREVYKSEPYPTTLKPWPCRQHYARTTRLEWAHQKGAFRLEVRGWYAWEPHTQTLGVMAPLRQALLQWDEQMRRWHQVVDDRDDDFAGLCKRAFTRR